MAEKEWTWLAVLSGFILGAFLIYVIMQKRKTITSITRDKETGAITEIIEQVL